MTRHNKLRNGVTNLSGKAFNPSYVRNSSLIYPGHAVWEVKDQPSKSATNNPPDHQGDTDQKGDLIISNLLQRGTDSINMYHEY